MSLEVLHNDKGVVVSFYKPVCIISVVFPNIGESLENIVKISSNDQKSDRDHCNWFALHWVKFAKFCEAFEENLKPLKLDLNARKPILDFYLSRLVPERCSAGGDLWQSDSSKLIICLRAHK